MNNKRIGTIGEEYVVSVLETWGHRAGLLGGNEESSDVWMAETELITEVKRSKKWWLPEWIRRAEEKHGSSPWVIWLVPRDRRTTNQPEAVVMSKELYHEMLEAWLKR